jgi:thiamine biosynthesis lipoprotein
MTLPQAVTFPALGTTATLVTTNPDGLGEARAVLDAELDAIDRACSRFRDDSELSAVNRAAGKAVSVTGLFADALDAALRAARLTSGAVDPTVGAALKLIGYDRDFDLVDPTGPALQVRLRAVPGWQTISLDVAAGTVAVPRGVQLDLGATAKALCADRAARRVADVAGDAWGVLVSLGGDVAVAGPAPAGGWAIQLADHHAARLDAGGPVYSLASGGLATSSTTVRRWQRGGRVLHHLVDPSTGAPAEGYWRTVSVAAGCCLDANIASCAAIIMDQAAPDWLTARGLPARLVDRGGRVLTVGGWPAETHSCQASACS